MSQTKNLISYLFSLLAARIPLMTNRGHYNSGLCSGYSKIRRQNLTIGDPRQLVFFSCHELGFGRHKCNPCYPNLSLWQLSPGRNGEYLTAEKSVQEYHSNYTRMFQSDGTRY